MPVVPSWQSVCLGTTTIAGTRLWIRTRRTRKRPDVFLSVPIMMSYAAMPTCRNLASVCWLTPAGHTVKPTDRSGGCTCVFWVALSVSFGLLYACFVALPVSFFLVFLCAPSVSVTSCVTCLLYLCLLIALSFCYSFNVFVFLCFFGCSVCFAIVCLVSFFVCVCDCVCLFSSDLYLVDMAEICVSALPLPASRATSSTIQAAAFFHA